MNLGVKAMDVCKVIFERIDKMSAITAMDKLIVCEVFKDDPDDFVGYDPLSRDNGLALIVLEKVNNEFGAECVLMPGGKTEVTLRWQPKTWSPQHFAPSYPVIGRAETFALAVCRAAAKIALMDKWDSLQEGNAIGLEQAQELLKDWEKFKGEDDVKSASAEM